jgi:hypothetical protein
MGGNDQGNNDPFSKTKFKIPPFSGSADPEAYLDWEMVVDQKFSSHQIPKEYRVKLATSEFTSFALFWWNDICNNANANAQIPQTWTVLKRRMKSRFVPPCYQRDLRLKLQHLNQGSKTVEEYYQELLIGLAHSNIQGDDMDKCSRFFLEVCVVKYRMFLTIKNGLDFPNYIIMLLKLKGKYRDDNLGDPRLHPRLHPFLHVQPR